MALLAYPIGQAPGNVTSQARTGQSLDLPSPFGWHACGCLGGRWWRPCVVTYTRPPESSHRSSSGPELTGGEFSFARGPHPSFRNSQALSSGEETLDGYHACKWLPPAILYATPNSKHWSRFLGTGSHTTRQRQKASLLSSSLASRSLPCASPISQRYVHPKLYGMNHRPVWKPVIFLRIHNH